MSFEHILAAACAVAVIFALWALIHDLRRGWREDEERERIWRQAMARHAELEKGETE